MAVVESAANYKDSSTAANIPIDGIIRTVTPTAPTSGESLRQTCAIGDGSDDDNLLAISPAGAAQVWSFSSTAALTQVAVSVTSVSLLAANPARKGFVVVNTGTQILYIAYGATAQATAFTYQLGSGQVLERETGPYQGAISGIWAALGGVAAVITELT